MLTPERDKMYIVYPTWVTYSYSWDDLPRILADPIAAGYPKVIDEDRKELYSQPVEKCELINGPVGNGIVVMPNQDNQTWLPMRVLRSEANVLSPTVMLQHARHVPFDVRYLEPMSGPLVEHIVGARRRAYLCVLATDHVQSAGDELFWAVSYEKGKRPIKGLDELPDWAGGFGLAVEALDCPPAAVAKETADWYKECPLATQWYRVSGGADGAGWQFSIVVYFGLHLRKYAGRRMRAMQLLASIPGEPAIWKNARW